MTEDELTELRAYKPAEVAQMLNIPITRLEGWVRRNLVPHTRAGVLRGVEFSAEDIREIARLRPELVGGRRGVRRADTSDKRQDGDAAAMAPLELPAQQLAEWAQLTAHQRRPRRARG